MRIVFALIVLALASPASAKVYILQWGKTYEVWETRGLYDYPVQGQITTLSEAKQVAKRVKEQGAK